MRDDDVPRHIITVTAEGSPGHTDWELRKLRAPFRGVRLAMDAPDDRAHRLAAAIASARVDGILTDLAAAAWWRLPLPVSEHHRTDGRVAVAVRAGQHRARGAGIRGRRLTLPDGHVTTSRGLTLTTLPRTWLDCAALLSLPDLTAMGDAALRRAGVAQRHLEEMVRWGGGRRGIVQARRALGLLDGRAATPGESIVRAHLRLGGVRAPQCNCDIYAGGDWLARGDMVWEAERVVVEFDGREHITEEQRRSDARRRNLLQHAGWLMIVFTWADCRYPERMVDLVRSALAARRPR